MAKKHRKTAAKAGSSNVQAFTFGDPEPVLSGAVYDALGVWLLDNGKYYSPPVPLAGLARLLRANAYHGPILEFKTNVTLRGFKASPVLPRRVMHAMTTDYMVFANAYLQKVVNWYTISPSALDLHEQTRAALKQCSGPHQVQLLLG
ncbi:hypothetical protein [Desulfovibrio alaskensis]|uniref:hypothetical protein n=1 Tax=Oleidesulfovibrio alaskensis TaxID=58180 RepID=UPI0003FA28A7